MGCAIFSFFFLGYYLPILHLPKTIVQQPIIAKNGGITNEAINF